ncbi:MAG TPA: glycosyltransferase, partial [Capsulimonadaceae bacterium]|nr:glycosyltransferase [Capsulimonadaceae bacterium]
MRITLIISSLQGGGAERAVSLIANYWAARGDCVTVVTLAKAETDAYSLAPEVVRRVLDLQKRSKSTLSALAANGQRVLALRKAIRRSRPDVVISFMGTINVLTLLAGVGLRIPIVIMEQIDPREYPIGKAWQILRRVIYPRASGLVVLTERLRNWAEAIIPRDRVYVIPNPVRRTAELNAGICALPDVMADKDRRRVIAMGRLAHQKGFDLLLRAFAICAAEKKDWDLVILGEGVERGNLETLIGQLGITDRVNLPGRLPEPATALKSADLFVLSSRFEGLPLALLEAMACGLPVISTDCPTGPQEVIRDGIDGILVPAEDVQALCAAMSRLMSDERERARLASAATEVEERFGLERVMANWDDVIARVSATQRSATSRVRICFLIHQLEAGGAERQLTTLLKGMDKSLFDITLITFKPGGRFSEEIAQTNIRLISLGKRRHWDLIAPFLRFVKIIRSIRPQIVHSYMPTSNVFAGFLRLFVKQTRIVWGIRAAQEDFGKADRLSALAFRAQCRLSGLADLVIANSEAGRQVCLRNGFPPERVIVIPNGIDIDRFQPDSEGRRRFREQWGIGDEQAAIGIVGRLHAVKDHSTFLHAAAALALERPDIRFVCIGDGDPDRTRQLEKLAADLGIGEKVVWTGLCPDMPAAYSALDLNTCCSLSEGFPNSIAEAMACGVPCVATDVGDCKLLIGATGKIVPPQS